MLPCKQILLCFNTHCLNLSLFKQFTMKILSYTQTEQQLLCLHCSTRMNMILICALLLVVFLSSFSSSPDFFNVVMDLNISDSILQQWFRMLLFDNHWLTTSDGHNSLRAVFIFSSTQCYRVSVYFFLFNSCPFLYWCIHRLALSCLLARAHLHTLMWAFDLLI